MRRYLPVLTLLLCTGLVQAKGLLVPEDKSLPPLAMVNHRVNIAIEDQVAITKVEQTFRNHTDRQLEATYIFPVPNGASVNKFTMWVDGKEVSGEMVEADKARKIYTDIVRRTQDPGLLEYMGHNLLRMRVFPIPPKGNQKVAMSYTAVAPRDAGVVEYVYPLKTDGKATQTLEEFSIQASIKSQHPIQTIYSPTHAITHKQSGDREATISFERSQGLLDRDFQLFYATGDKDIGFTTLLHRPISTEKGYFLLLISPRVELSKEQTIPRDMVYVLDTSGSMRGPKMDQARRALKYCLSNLNDRDRFAVLNFATTINRYRDGLVDAGQEQVDQAKKWVENLEATGGTAINDALAAALDLRSTDTSRTFTIVFFTDGMPTIGETNPEKILKNVSGKNTTNTRMFTFGVGDDVNATLLDQLAEQTRAVSTYVRPAEDIEAKVSSLYSKISHPVLANLKLSAGETVRLEETYPPQLPDLFHGGQLVVLGRYSGLSHAAVTLTGMVGKEPREFVYEVNFPDKTNDDKNFVEHLWARRKVGYLLDQIRANGAKKELVDEIIVLAKKYGIATPYTSYLIVPDGPVPVASGGGRTNLFRFGGAGGIGGSITRDQAEAMRKAGAGRFGYALTPAGTPPPALAPDAPAAAPQRLADYAKKAQSESGKLSEVRTRLEEERLNRTTLLGDKDGKDSRTATDPQILALQQARAKKSVLDEARRALARSDRLSVQGGKLGVELSLDSSNLRTQAQVAQSALRNVAGRSCLELGGIWIDEGFDAKMPVVAVKAQSDAYFRLLERQPQLKEVFQLGNYVVWVTPNGSALVIDLNHGKDKLTDAEIDQLFVAKK